MKVLVTGAAGFIGSHVAEALLGRGDTVTGVDCFLDYYPRAVKERNLAGPRSHDGFSFVEADLATAPLEPLVDGCDAVIHLAAQAGVRASWGQDFRIYVDSNIHATQRLLEACSRHESAPLSSTRRPPRSTGMRRICRRSRRLSRGRSRPTA